MAGSRFPVIESGIDALREDVFAALTAHANETDGKIKLAIHKTEQQLVTLLQNIDREAANIKRAIEELRHDVDGLKMFQGR